MAGRCGATLRRKPGRFCTAHPLTGKTRCALHGGKSLAGPAHGNWKHGMYSTVLPGALGTHYATARQNPALVALSEQIALVDAKVFELFEQVRDSGPLARVAETGTAMLSMRNDAGNAAWLQGYYSPNQPAGRAGFGYGTGFRLAVTYGGTTYYKFRGRIVEIDPVAGQYGLQRTRCRAVDWMEDLAAGQDLRVAAQRDQRADDLLTTLITAMLSTARPAAQILARGTEPYPYAFYDLGGGTSGRAVAQKLMQSELGHLAVIGDTTQGGTLRFFNRHHRATADSAVALPNTMHGLRVPSAIDRAFNDVRVTINPVRVDATATTVLWALRTEPASSRPVIPAGQTRTFWGDYHDPDREAQLIGGTDQVAPVATTDYAANAAQ